MIDSPPLWYSSVPRLSPCAPKPIQSPSFCSFLEKGKDRIEYCKNLAEEYDVDGIVFQTIKFCDLWGYESLSFIDGMKNNNIPVVTINREYAMTGEGQLRTRIQAFIESIKNKKDLCSVSK